MSLLPTLTLALKATPAPHSPCVSHPITHPTIFPSLLFALYITHTQQSYRHQVRSLPESVLREECARLKAQLSEGRAEVERERRVRSEAELEKEHFRSQMHRLALALKREREKSATIARQELEQLRLEFLAREERYILDGDRDELRSIRYELANLRAQTGLGASGRGPAPPDSPDSTDMRQPPSSAGSRGKGGINLYRLQNELSILLAAGYAPEDDVVRELQAAIAIEQQEGQ